MTEGRGAIPGYLCFDAQLEEEVCLQQMYDHPADDDMPNSSARPFAAAWQADSP